MRALRLDSFEDDSVSPSLTAWPSSTMISLTTPASSASTGISIFIDSRITTVSPSSTESPGETSIFQTVPVMCASIAAKSSSSSRACGRRSRGRITRRAARDLVHRTRRDRDRARRGRPDRGDARGAREAFPGARVVLAESGSRDATAAIAERAGAEVVRTARRRAGRAARRRPPRARRWRCRRRGAAPFVLCDGDLGGSAAAPRAAGRGGRGGRVRPRRRGLLAPGRRRLRGRGRVRPLGDPAPDGRRARAPISGQRAMRGRRARAPAAVRRRLRDGDRR